MFFKTFYHIYFSPKFNSSMISTIGTIFEFCLSSTVHVICDLFLYGVTRLFYKLSLWLFFSSLSLVNTPLNCNKIK